MLAEAVKRPEPSESSARLVEACRAHGLPVTVQRREVFSALMRRSDHPTADEIYDLVRARLVGISRATVYRVLETLVRVGVARKVPHPGTAARFDPIVARHHHFSCLVCDRLVDIDLPAVSSLPLPVSQPGVRITDYSLHYTGTCDTCVDAPPRGNRKRAAARRQSGASTL